MPTHPLDPLPPAEMTSRLFATALTSSSTSRTKEEVRRLPPLPLEIHHLIIRHVVIDETINWDNFYEQAALLLPLMHVCRAWLTRAQRELVRELVISSPEQARLLLKHSNNFHLLRHVKVLRIGGVQALSWASLVVADTLKANTILNCCEGLTELWVRNMHSVDFDSLLVSKYLRSLSLFCCSFLSDQATPPPSRPLSRVASRAASRSNSRCSTPRPFDVSPQFQLSYLTRLYLVNCRIPPSKLASLTSETLPSLTALGFGSNFLEDPVHPHSDNFMADITLEAIDPSLLPSLRCLSAGDELDRMLNQMPNLALLDCWESSLTNKVTETIPLTLQRLRLCESSHRMAIMNNQTDDEEEPVEWWAMQPLIKRFPQLPQLHEVHLPGTWFDSDRYAQLLSMARERNMTIEWDDDVEKSGFDLDFWDLVDQIEQSDRIKMQ